MRSDFTVSLQLTKSLGDIFEDDQLAFLSSGGTIKRPSQWSEKTFAKAFKLRLNCGNRAYNYLLEEVKKICFPTFLLFSELSSNSPQVTCLVILGTSSFPARHEAFIT